MHTNIGAQLHFLAPEYLLSSEGVQGLTISS